MAKLGRKTKYKKEYDQGIVDYFQEFYDHLEEREEIPFFTAYAREIDVGTSSLARWKKKHKSFKESYQRAKEIQKECLIVGALKKIFNPTFAIFTAKNITNMRDRREFEHSGNVTISSILDEIDKKG